MPIKEHDKELSKHALDIRRMNLQDYARRPEAIGRGRDHWGRMGIGSRADFDAFLLTREMHPESIPYARAAAQGPLVVAFINDNRWMARCECGGLAVVDPDEPEFYCHGCFNVANGGVAIGRDAHGGYPRPVVFPPAKQQQEIAEALLVSDDPLWRNWTAIDEDGEQPGSARVNREVSPQDVAASIVRLAEANEAVKKGEVIDDLLG